MTKYGVLKDHLRETLAAAVSLGVSVKERYALEVGFCGWDSFKTDAESLGNYKLGKLPDLEQLGRALAEEFCT